ncbi:MAG: hypothetical protein ACJ762_18195 [Solirubrobacteraceae bacterium]
MHETTRKVFTGVAALAAAGGITAGIAGAAKDDKTKQRDRFGDPAGYGYGAPRVEQEALTGETKDKAEAAALAAVPGGKVVRSEKGGPDGAAYHVHVTDADGKDLLVLLDADFKVTDKLSGPPRGGPGGHRGPGGPGGPAQEALTGDAKAKAEAAATAAVPGGTIERSEKGGQNGAAYHVHMSDKDGKHVVVLLDSDFKVTDTVTEPEGGRGGMPRPEQLTGDTADKAKAAALAAVPNGTVRASFAAPDGSGAKYVVLVERKNGRPVMVLLDADFKLVKKVTRPPFGGHGRPGDPGPGGPPRGAGYAPQQDTTTT